MKRNKIFPLLNCTFRQVLDALEKQADKTVTGPKTTGKGVVFNAKADINRDGREFIKLPHNNRIYEGDWGYTTNSMGKDGQRIGQYATPLDVCFKKCPQEYSLKYNKSSPRISVKGDLMNIFENAAMKITDFNTYPDRPRESYHCVLNARGGRKSLVDMYGNVIDEHLRLIDWALRSYFIMNRGNRMGESIDFMQKLSNKLQSMRSILAKFSEVTIDSADLEEYKVDAEGLYESFSNREDGLSRDNTYFCVGATKVLHCIFPELFIVLDLNVGEALGFYYGRHNNFESYWKAMKICRGEVIKWQRIHGSTDSLIKLDVPPTTVTRIFDKCASIMAIRAREQSATK